MRRLILTVVVVVTLCMFAAACSYPTHFVIINESDGPITVYYEIKDFPGSFYLPDVPVVVPASELNEDGQEWQPVQYEVDEATRSVTTQLMPGQALRIARMNHYTSHDYPGDEQKYQIRSIIVSGARGALTLTDEQARTSFTKVALTLFTLTYK